MKKYGVNELRRMYLEFFESKDHLKMNSFSLVPQNDKSLLLINAGMAPLKPYFTGQEIPPRRRVTTCQKCVRTGDIENVGKTARHLTFFEMLGNFSFGDYFKHEAIAWSWEFLTKVIGLDENRLYPSIYLDDDEAFDIWNKEVGVAKERIFRFGKADNFWEHGAGPCGPCSEIYYDRGEKYGCGKPGCTVGCDCDRYMEVWNNVFTQFNGDGKGGYEELENKNIDTGMGLERLAVVCQDVDTVFDIDTMKALRDRVCELAGVAYESDPKKDVSIRLITDHIRSVTFMTSDGILPSNEGRGYVLRRLLRRAARHGRLLGIQGQFLAKLCETVIRDAKDGYPELEEKKDYIFSVLNNEEEKFNKTIDQGLEILAGMEEALVAEGKTVLGGDDAFKLYDTYGFPLDLTEEILAERGMTIDMDGYKKAMDAQRTLARNSRKKTNYMGADATVYDEIDPSITSEFVGYDKDTNEGKILVMTKEENGNGSIVTTLTEGESGAIIADKTVCYATMGGQQGDCGRIYIEEEGEITAEFDVVDTIKLKGGKIAHIGTVIGGSFTTGDNVTIAYDRAKRLATAKNHSATHLLQKALRTVLGTHVEQAGSFVNPERLRFDFSHFNAMTKEEIEKVEELVNEAIAADYPVVTKIMTIDEARKTGAMALFGEKYGESVRVVDMGGYSIELCGGTHVANTGSIASFKIVSESGIAAGTRRIEAITAGNVIAHYKTVEEELFAAARAAKCDPANLAAKIEALNAEIKAAYAENEKLKAKMADASLEDILSNFWIVKGVKILTASVPNLDMGGLRSFCDRIKEKLGDSSVIVLASVNDDKVNLVTAATDGAIAKGAHAGNLIKEIASIVGGGGGGRPNMAQAGGKNPAGVDACIEKAKEVAAAQLG
ncbi:MAG: alanine--tRNA ligase [Lachnospiraceae bacterium]|nr:alanine--tRNA ligase [Lachnospiraceae bacterium]